MQESYSKSINVNDSAVYDVKKFRSSLGAVMQLTDYCRLDRGMRSWRKESGALVRCLLVVDGD